MAMSPATTLSVLALVSIFQVGVSYEDCPAQVIVTTQTELKNQIRDEIGRSLKSFFNATDSAGERCLALVRESATEIQTTLGAISRRLDSIEKKMDTATLGSSSSNAASSCAEILKVIPASPSGYYWVNNGTGNPHNVYCDMIRSCGGVVGGWLRVAGLDMTNSSHHCPSGLTQRTDSGIRSCAAISNAATCSSVLYMSRGIQYSRVCGKITAYHGGSLDAFDNLNRAARRYSIDSNYVDGVSLTHGRSPRRHLWTFAAGGWCPTHTAAPGFVGTDYFYDLDRSEPINLRNPLWDGEDCRNQCCPRNSPPWFHKQLPQPTTDDIEMRVCRDQERSNEDLAISSVDIFVQ